MHTRRRKLHARDLCADRVGIVQCESGGCAETGHRIAKALLGGGVVMFGHRVVFKVGAQKMAWRKMGAGYQAGTYSNGLIDSFGGIATFNEITAFSQQAGDKLVRIGRRSEPRMIRRRFSALGFLR